MSTRETADRPVPILFRDYYDDLVHLGPERATTWAQVPTVPYALRPADDRRDIGWSATMALARLKEGRAHWKIRPHSTTSPSSLGGWKNTRDRHVRTYADPSPTYPAYLDGAHQRMLDQQRHAKQTFLGVEVGARGPLEQIRERLPMSDRLVPPATLDRWHKAADGQRDALHRGALHANPVSAVWLRQLRQHTAYRGLTVPDPSVTGRKFFGYAQIVDEFRDVQWTPVTFPTRKGLRTALRVQSPAAAERTFTASWVVAVMPQHMPFPDTPPWLAHADGLPFPCEVDVHLELVPPRKALRGVKHRLGLAADQAQDAGRAGVDLPIQTSEIIALAREWEYQIPTRRMPMVYGRVVLHAEADTAEDLAGMYEQAEERYADLGIDLAWPGGMSQADLLMQSIPGGPEKFGSYRQMWPIETIGCGLPHAGSGLSHPTGMYCGVTTGRIKEVVTWDPHWAIRRSAEQGDRHVEAQGGTVLLGAQRSGKSNAVVSIAYEHAQARMPTILIDFGGETARIADLLPEQIDVVDVLTAGGGTADPMSTLVVPGAVDDPQARSARERLTYETLRTLAWQQVAASADSQVALQQAIRKVSGSTQPSTHGVLETLRASKDRPARNLGESLHFLLSTVNEGDIIVGEGGSALGARQEKPVTIFTGKGMVMAEAGKPLSDWTGDELLGGAVFGVVGYRARRMLWNLPRDLLKTLLIDEAHVALATPAGHQVISDCLRHGPKYGLATLMATHNASAVSADWIASAVSTWMLFRASDDDEISKGLDRARIENTRGNRDLRRGLKNGECFLVLPGDERDRMQWDRWHPGLTRAANTTAGRRAEQETVVDLREHATSGAVT